LLVEDFDSLALSKTRSYGVKSGNSDKNFGSNAAIVTYIVESEDLSQRYLLIVIRGNTYRNELVNQAIASARQHIEGMLGTGFTLKGGVLF